MPLGIRLLGAQQDIAKRHGFRVLRHRHELYGYCADCQQQAS